MEAVVWFVSPVAAADRAAIERSLPAPVASVYSWGDRHLYFGSEGDSYEAQIDDWDAFARELEDWARSLHTKHSIAFLFYPSTEGDDGGRHSAWHTWTTKQYDTLAPLVLELDDATARWVRYALLAAAPAGAGGVEAVNALCEHDGITGEIGPLSWEVSRLRQHASLVDRLLAKAKTKDARSAVILTLTPYTRLSFFAAYPKNTPYLVKGRLAWVKELDELIRAIDRPPALVASLLHQVARGVAALDGKADASAIAHSQAKQSTPLWDRCFAYADCPLAAYVDGSAVYQCLEDWRRVLELGQQCEARLLALPKAQRMTGAGRDVDTESINYSNILLAAQKLRLTNIELDYVEKTAKLESTLPSLLLNQLYTLINVKQYARAREIARAYRARGGDLTPQVLANLVVINTFTLDATKDVDFLNEAIRLCQSGPGNRYVCDAILLENLGWPINERRDCRLMLDLIAEHERATNRPLTAGLVDRQLFASIFAEPPAQQVERARAVVARHREQSRFFANDVTAVSNAAGVLVKQGHRDEGITALGYAKQLGYPIARTLDDDDYASIRDDPRYRALL
jgi:hypothetical protein